MTTKPRRCPECGTLWKHTARFNRRRAGSLLVFAFLAGSGLSSVIGLSARVVRRLTR